MSAAGPIRSVLGPGLVRATCIGAWPDGFQPSSVTVPPLPSYLGPGEVGEDRRAGRVHDDVRRFEVAVDDLLRMGVMNGNGRPGSGGRTSARRSSIVLASAMRAASGLPSMKSIVNQARLSSLPHGEEADHVGMAELGDDFRLALESAP